MVIALIALSLALIVSGIAAVVQGFPYVRLESGLAMVIGGTTAASAGMILLGLSAVVMQLRRLEGLRGAQFGNPADRREDASTSGPALRAPAIEVAAPVASLPQPDLAGAAGLAGVSLGAAEAAGRLDPVGAGKPSDRDAVHAFEREPMLPDLPTPEATAQPGPDEDLFARPEDRPGQLSPAAERPTEDIDEPKEAAIAVHDEAQHAFALRPSVEPSDVGPEPPAVEREPPQSPAAQAEPARAERQAVGSYASGGNTYVMYSDGTIDADTPRGCFTFQSLDELKEFVATGEAGERGAA